MKEAKEETLKASKEAVASKKESWFNRLFKRQWITGWAISLFVCPCTYDTRILAARNRNHTTNASLLSCCCNLTVTAVER